MSLAQFILSLIGYRMHLFINSKQKISIVFVLKSIHFMYPFQHITKEVSMLLETVHNVGRTPAQYTNSNNTFIVLNLYLKDILLAHYYRKAKTYQGSALQRKGILLQRAMFSIYF